MASSRHARMSDYEFIRATQIEARECESAHDVAWNINLALDGRRSVINIRLEAREVDAEGGDRQLAAYSTEWPNAYVQTFPACLFQAAIQLTRLVEDSRRDELMPSRAHQAAR